MLNYNQCFENNSGSVKWTGRQVQNAEMFDKYLQNDVGERLTDEEHLRDLENDLKSLSTTDMANEYLHKLLLATERKYEDWEVGEALAECLLEAEYNIKWPWNTERDKKTPKASLPGADLVGFLEQDDRTVLVIGEVKTSSDTKIPPGVMNGRSGLRHQIDTLASSIKVHSSLIRWLHCRCKNSHLKDVFEEAIKTYLASEGKDIALFGLLMRDTSPEELDLRNRGRQLGSTVCNPMTVNLIAWYLPRSISHWVDIMMEGFT